MYLQKLEWTQKSGPGWKCSAGKDAARNEKNLKQFERRIKDVYEEILAEYP